METIATMPRKKETTSHREPVPTLDTVQLLETAWPHCGMIQEIIDRLNESGSYAELRLLTNRLQRLAFRATPKGDFDSGRLSAWVGG
jgi:hypothetical protein